MSEITGTALRYDGLPVDYVSIFNWADGKCIVQVVPDALGKWSYRYIKNLTIGITYVSNGCEPVTHGAYEFVYTGAPIDTILHYDFNGNALDQSDNALNGIRTGNTNFVTGRKAGTQALEFVAGCVRTPIALPINSDKLTVSFWMSANQTDTAVVIETSTSATANVNNNSFGCYINDTVANTVQSLTNIGFSSLNIATAPISFDNNFQYIVIEIDRSKAAIEEQKIYINNVLASSPVSHYINDSTGNFDNYVLYIGQRNASQFPFVGKMQDLRVYNRVLTSDERTTLFNE